MSSGWKTNLNKTDLIINKINYKRAKWIIKWKAIISFCQWNSLKHLCNISLQAPLGFSGFNLLKKKTKRIT